jgi:hypothetical protein
MTWSHVCTLYISCNIVVTLMAHLKHFQSNCHMKFLQDLKKSNMVDYICMYDVSKLAYRGPIFNSFAIIIQLIDFLMWQFIY